MYATVSSFDIANRLELPVNLIELICFTLGNSRNSIIWMPEASNAMINYSSSLT